MNRSATPSFKRLRTALALALAAAAASPQFSRAESVVFNADFAASPATNFLATSNSVPTATTPTPTGTTWYGATSKTSGATFTLGAFGPIIGYAGTTGPLEMMARFTPTTAPVSVSVVGDYIQAQGSFYTTGLSQVAVGLYNSGGVDPLFSAPNGTEMVKAGLVATAGAAGGTLGWVGYRARADSGSTTAQISNRPAQTGTPTYIAYDLIASSSSPYNSPGGASISTASIPVSASSVTWDTAGGTLYNFIYRIERKSATAYTISYTIKNSDNTATLYSVSGDTTAAASLPSAVTSAFDALAVGVRGATNPVSFQLLSVSVTGKNSDIARVATQPLAQNFPNGGSGSLSVIAGGTGPFGYQWYKDNAPISGATSATYNISGASAAHVGNYYAVVTNAYGSETSATVAVNVSSVSAPSFTTQPTAQTVNEGTTLTLTALASGVPTPTYQWFKGTSPSGTTIVGATSATYTVSNATAAAAGSYYVVATNSQGSTSSNSVNVTINSAAPVITVPPTGVSVNVGAAINLSVTATGFPAPTYQWFKGTTAISGATSSTYSIASAVSGDAGDYKVTVTNIYGAPTSTPVPVVVNVVAPSITTQPPANLTVYYGKRITLTAAYAGSAPLTYQWYKGASPISGAISSTYTIPSATVADAGSYHVVVTNESTNATSGNTVLSVVFPNETPVFATNFATDTLNNPSTPIASDSTSWFILAGRLADSSAVGDDPATTDVVDPRLNVTWNTSASSAAVETAARFSATPVALTTTGDYIRLRATFKSSGITILGFGLFNSKGVSPVALNTSAENLSVGSSALGVGTEKWVGYRSAITDGGTSGDVGTRPVQSGSNNHGNELILPLNSTSVAFSEPAGVSAGVVPSLGTAAAITANTVYTLEYSIVRTATNQNTISYSLYSGSSASGSPLYTTNATTTTAEALPSAVTTEFDGVSLGMKGTGVPSLAISNLSIVKGSALAGVAPSFTTHPSSQTLAPGATLALTAAASGTPAPTLQWYKNDAPIPGATDTTYSIAPVATSDSGAYKVIATSGAGSATSNVATIVVGSTSAFETWSSGQGLTAGVNDGTAQDPDNDGVNNLLEFVLGGNPLAASSSVLPVVAQSAGNVTLTFDLKVAAKTDYTIIVESSTDLTTWNPVTHGVGGATVVETVVDGSTNHVVATVPNSGAKTFLRVKVTSKS